MSSSSSSSSRLRMYGPRNLGVEDGEFAADQDLERGIGKELLAKIRRCYGRVRLVDVGFCFGLLDPVRNILVGQAIALADRGDGELPEELEEEEGVIQRSLDGLVAFLVALFPYLTYYRAMWYLNKADLDPLVAARIVVTHRGMDRTFGFTSDATVAAVEMALRCAAAQHPNPRHFALGWKLLSPSLQEVAAVLSRRCATQDPLQLIPILKMLQQQPPSPMVLSLDKPWELASCRLSKLNLSLGEEMNPVVVPRMTIRRRLRTAIGLASCRLGDLNPPPVITSKFPPVPRATLRRMLLTTIHGYYLQALALLPKDKLRSHYHHSLLHAGHCYGPLDPVTNIVVNTLWYAQVYPLTLEEEVELEAISTRALLRIGVRSLYGLISFVCTRYPALTPVEALQSLQAAGADIQKAHDDDPAFLGNYSGALVPVEEAYAAAAKAAHHPRPLQQAEFLGPSNPLLSGLSQLLKLEEPGKARPLVLDYFRAAVASTKPAEEMKNISVFGPFDYSCVMGWINEFWNQHNRAVGMAKSAIDMYNLQLQQHGVTNKYELHVICGVNELVGGRFMQVPFANPSRWSHINFLATQTAAGTPPELFFAECRNDGSGVELCCPVAIPLPGTEEVRCPYCELQGSRIVHPAKESFRGRVREFEKMLRGEGVYSETRMTDKIINVSQRETLLVGNLEEDMIYGDYMCDNNIVEEKFARDVID